MKKWRDLKLSGSGDIGSGLAAMVQSMPHGEGSCFRNIAACSGTAQAHPAPPRLAVAQSSPADGTRMDAETERGRKAKIYARWSTRLDKIYNSFREVGGRRWTVRPESGPPKSGSQPLALPRTAVRRRRTASNAKCDACVWIRLQRAEGRGEAGAMGGSAGACSRGADG